MSKTVLFKAIQFSVRTEFKYKNSPISNNSVWYKYAVGHGDTSSNPRPD